MENKKKKNKKKKYIYIFFIFFVKLGIFCLELERNTLFGIGNGAEFWVIESPDTCYYIPPTPYTHTLGPQPMFCLDVNAYDTEYFIH